MKPDAEETRASPPPNCPVELQPGDTPAERQARLGCVAFMVAVVGLVVLVGVVSFALRIVKARQMAEMLETGGP